MDQYDHADGAVDMMTPHQKHLGPHMRWTELRTANADDAKRADQIVQTLRQALAKYKDYRVAIVRADASRAKATALSFCQQTTAIPGQGSL